MLMLTIAVRNVFRHRVRSLISISAISFGCVCVIFMSGYIVNVYQGMSESYIRGRTGHLQIYRTGYSERGLREPFRHMIDNPQDVRVVVAALPHVASVTSRVEISGLASAGSNSGPCVIQGVESDAVKTVLVTENARVDTAMAETGIVLKSGSALEQADTYSALVGLGLAHGLGLTDNAGLALTVTTEHGGINALDIIVKGIFQTSYKPFDDRYLKIPLATAQELMDTVSIHALVIYLDETKNTKLVREELRALIAKKGWDLEMKDWRELNDFYVQTEMLFDRMFGVIRLVLAIVVILSIYNTLSMAVLERVNEIGTLRALGTKRSRIIGLFILESAVLGVAGSVIGIALGCLFTAVIGRIGINMPPPPGASMAWVSEPVVTLSGTLAALILSVSTAVIASIIPSFRASRLDIAEALRQCN